MPSQPPQDQSLNDELEALGFRVIQPTGQGIVIGMVKPISSKRSKRQTNRANDSATGSEHGDKTEDLQNRSSHHIQS